MIRIEEIVETAALESLRDQWWRLWEECPAATPFQTPGWLLTWWKLFAPGELWTLAAWDGSRLAGLAPLFLESGSSKLLPLGIGITDYIDFLAVPDRSGRVLAAFAEKIAAAAPRWTLADFQDLPPGSLILQLRFPAGLTTQLDRTNPCPVAALPGSAEEFLAALPSGLRRNLRRYREHMSRAGRLQFETASEGILHEFMEAFFRLDRARWQAKGLPGALQAEDLQRFHREVAAQFFERGLLRVYGLRFEGELAAALLAFFSRGRALAYLSSFEPSLGGYSPGILLQHYSIGCAIAEGCREFDFLRGDEGYKYGWGARDRWNARLVVRPAA